MAVGLVLARRRTDNASAYHVLASVGGDLEARESR